MTDADRAGYLERAITRRIYSAVACRQYEVLYNLNDTVDQLLQGGDKDVRDVLLCKHWPFMKPRDAREMKLLHDHLVAEQLQREVDDS